MGHFRRFARGYAICGAAIWLCGNVAAPPARAEETKAFFIHGIGKEPCALWTRNRALDSQVMAWLQGFFSANNMDWNSQNTMVGHQANGLGIMEEARKICADSPSQAIAIAASATWKKLLELNR